MEKVDYIVVHSTKTQENLKITESYKTDYNYLIGVHGECWGGKRTPIEEDGLYYIHLAYVGGLDRLEKVKDTRTQKQKQTMWFMMKDLLRKYKDAKVLGDNPGFDAEEEYKNIV